MKYHRLNAELFVKNRARFVAQLPPRCIAIFVSNDAFPSNGDALHSSSRIVTSTGSPELSKKKAW
jgi:hypothetical protein